MPFAAINLPSIALTQLSAAVKHDFDSEIEPDILYLNHDFNNYFGSDAYNWISNSGQATIAGLGDWLFRHAAFPAINDNAIEYFNRYGPFLGLDRKLLEAYDDKRRNIEVFLDELIDQYKLVDYDLVGFTSMFTQNVASFAMANRIKKKNKKTVTVMGGANCETTMGAVIARNVGSIDYVFSGPALKNFSSLIEQLNNGETENCHKITGVYSKKKLERIIGGSTPEIGEELSLDVHLPLEYDDFLQSLEAKSPHTKPSLLFETSRGCWWGQKAHCTFCGLNGTTMNYRSMSAENALKQFNELFRYYPEVSRFESVDNIIPTNYLEEVFPKLDTPKDASLFYEVKADLKDDEMKVLADAGVTIMQPGIEALSSSTLKLMKKGTTAFQNIRFLKNCLKYGIHANWNLLIGFPGEKEDVYEKYIQDIPHLVHLIPPAGAVRVRFDRYSPYYTFAEEYGLKLQPFDYYSMVYPFAGQEINDLAYFFNDQNFSNEYNLSASKWIKKIEVVVQLWINRWNQRDGALQPTLTLQNDGNGQIIHDTRSGAPLTHEIDELGMSILKHLDTPTNITKLAHRLRQTPVNEINTNIEKLQQRGLVFRENNRFISLVVT